MTLGEIATVRNGIFASRPNNDGRGVRILRISSVRDGRVDTKDQKFVEGLNLAQVENFTITPGDLLMTRYSGSRRLVGISGIVPDRVERIVYPDKLMRLTVRKDLADSRFVNMQLAAGPARDHIEARIKTTAGQSGVSGADVKSAPVVIPPLEEQLQLVDVLEDHLSRLTAAVTGLDRAQRMADRLRQKAMAAAVAQAGGEVRPLGEWLEASIGGIWGSEAGDDEIPVRVLRVTELKPWGRITPETAARRSCTPSQFSKRRLGSGDLLLEKSGGGPTTPVGRVGLVPPLSEDSVCSNFMQLLRPDRRFVVPEFLHAALNVAHFRGITASMQTASTNIRNIKASDYLRLPVAVPSISVQETAVARIAHIADGTEAFRQSTQAAARRGAALRRSLLQAAFSGRLVPRASPETLREGGAR